MNRAYNVSGLSQTTATLLESESALFEKEYKKYFTPGESKPKSIGAPFFLHSPMSETGVLLIHGLMAAPEEVREWADFLHKKGLTVYAPRLSGHGTSSADLSGRTYKDWIDSVERGRKILKSCCKKIVVAGFSTGAGLALQSAILKPDAFEAVITVSAPFKFKSFSSNFAEILHGFNQLYHSIDMEKHAKRFVTNHADNPHINYLRCPVSAFVQVKSLMRKVRRSLKNIRIPALVIQGNKDPKVDPESGPAIFRLVGSDKKHFSWIDYNLHGIVRGAVGTEVFTEVESFLADNALISR